MSMSGQKRELKSRVNHGKARSEKPVHSQCKYGTGSAIAYEDSYNGNTADKMLILLCFVNSLFEYVQTAFQLHGQRSGLVKISNLLPV